MPIYPIPFNDRCTASIFFHASFFPASVFLPCLALSGHVSEDLDRAVEMGLAPVRYVDDFNVPTQDYPMNPNGSPLGIAGTR